MQRALGFVSALLAAGLLWGGIVEDVRKAVGRKDFAAAERSIAEYRKQGGAAIEMIEALSWLGRGTLAAGQLDKAEACAQETHKLAVAQLKTCKLDDEKRLPLALGAAIEVEAQVLAARGERTAAVDFLNRELAAYRTTSIRPRIQKNINLLSLEGKTAPRLEGVELPKGRPVLLFFWAHWCPDCKNMAPVLGRLKREYGAKGLAVVAPTQRYGYVKSGQEAAPEEELKYIDQVRKEQYPGLLDVPAPVNEENMRNYGSSTTPTIVLVDARGVVRLYHPGQMTYAELEPQVRRLF